MVNEHDGMIEAILRGIGVLMTDRQTDICDSRVAFATEKNHMEYVLKTSFCHLYLHPKLNVSHQFRPSCVSVLTLEVQIEADPT